MSSLKTVQEEIEKALAATLRSRLKIALDDGQLDVNKLDTRDVEKLKANNVEGELYLRLFIRSRQGDLEKAYDMMIESLKWRKDYSIHDFIERNETNWLERDNVKGVLKEGILFYHNTDKKRNPILIFQGNKYKYKNHDDNEKILEKLFAYLLEKQHQKNFGKQLLVICDHQNATLEHIDLKFFKFVVNLFNVYYPHILDAFLVVDVSWRVSSAWRNIQKWLSPDTSPKFKFVQKDQLLNYVDKEKLLGTLGGTDRFEYKYPPEEAPNPLDLPEDETGISSETDSHGNFEDAIPADPEETTDSIIAEKVSRDTESMFASLETSVRNRFHGHSRGRQLPESSNEEITSVDDEISENKLIISPEEEITFQETTDANEVHETLKLTNNCSNKLIFKIKTNSAAHFRVKPSMGWLKPGCEPVEVIVLLLLKGERSEEKHQWNKDKFLILYAEHPEEIPEDTNIAEVWRHTPKHMISEYKLNCRVLDINGLEKRPKTIDDAIEINLKLQQQIFQLQTKIENFSYPLTDIKDQLNHQRLFLVVISIFMMLLLLVAIVYWFR